LMEHDKLSFPEAVEDLAARLGLEVPHETGNAQPKARRTDDSVGFSKHYIHDVRNAGERPAVSVHAYSPPLTSMTYYDLEAGELIPIATVLTDDPEHELTAADLEAAS